MGGGGRGGALGCENTALVFNIFNALYAILKLSYAYTYLLITATTTTAAAATAATAAAARKIHHTKGGTKLDQACRYKHKNEQVAQHARSSLKR